MYDIIHDIIEKPWYHIWYHSLPIPCAIWYCHKSMISYMISYMMLKKLWYHLQKIIFNIIPDPFLALFSWLISYTFHTFLHMISVTWYIIAIWYHGFSDIASYIMAPARQPGTPSLSLTPTDGAAWPSSFKFTGSVWHLANLNAHHIYSRAVIQVLLVAALGSQAQD